MAIKSHHVDKESRDKVFEIQTSFLVAGYTEKHAVDRLVEQLNKQEFDWSLDDIVEIKENSGGSQLMDNYEVERMVEDAISRLRSDLEYQIDEIKTEFRNAISNLKDEVRDNQDYVISRLPDSR